MNIEVGKTYETRNGQTATVEREYKEEPVFPFFGRVFDEHGKADRIAYWSPAGRYTAEHQSPIDLIAEL